MAPLGLRMALVSGTMVTASVRLAHALDAGAMGSAWVADHLGLDTQVAVKFIAAEGEPDRAELLARFKREAAVAASLQSPHVVRMLDHGVMDDGAPFIVMELLRGESLAARLAREGALDPALVVDIVR